MRSLRLQQKTTTDRVVKTTFKFVTSVGEFDISIDLDDHGAISVNEREALLALQNALEEASGLLRAHLS